VYRAEWDSFICAIRKGTPPENPAESAILPTLIMQAQIDSAAPGQEIAVRDLAQRCSFQY